MKYFLKSISVFVFLVSCINICVGREGWKSKPKFENVPDSLNTYDAVNIFVRTKIEIKFSRKFDLVHTIHQKTKIIKPAGINSYSQFYVTNPELIESIRARTIKPDGSSIDLEDSEIKISKNESNSGYCMFVIPGVSVGDEVEFLISYVQKNTSSIDDIFLHQNSYCIKSEFVLEPSNEIIVGYKSYNQMPEPRIDLVRDTRSYTWTLTGLRPFQEIKRTVFHNELPFLRVAIRELTSKYGFHVPIQSNNWVDLQKNFQFGDNLSKMLSYDKGLSDFVDRHMGSEVMMPPEERMKNFQATINYITDSLELYWPKDTLESKKKLGEFLAEGKLPIAYQHDLILYLLERTFFKYFICIGRSKYYGDIDLDFVSLNQITDYFFVFQYEDNYNFVFPKKRNGGYYFGEIPNHLEGTVAILFPRYGASKNTNSINVPYSKLNDNSKTLSSLSFVNLSDNSIYEKNKLITSGALTSEYRNLYWNLIRDSVDLDLIYQYLFNCPRTSIDSMSLISVENTAPFLFSLKFDKTRKLGVTSLNNELKSVSLDKIISYLMPTSEQVSLYSKIQLPFLFSDIIKYYLIFEKDVKLIEQEANNMKFENEYGAIEIQVQQVNSKTIYLFAKLVFNKSNLNDIDFSSFFILGDKINEIKNSNLTIRILE